MKTEERRSGQRKEIYSRIVQQISTFIDKHWDKPYCVLEDVIGPYYKITNRPEDLHDLLAHIDKKFKVLLLSESPSDYFDLEVRVKKVAIQRIYPPTCDQEVLEAWKAEYKGMGKPGVLGLDNNYVATFEEIGEKRSSKL